MIMSKTGGALARRQAVRAVRRLAATIACVVAMTFVVSATVTPAHAAYDAGTWSGYGDHGYVGKPKRHRKSAFSRGIRKQVVRSERRSRKVARSGKRQRYAALHSSATDAVAPKAKPGLGSGGGIRWAASSACLNGTLRAVVAQVAANYGSVTVNSTCRSRGHNRRVGGAPRSQHLSGNAVDFRVHGNARAVYAFLRSSGSVGGLKHYGGGLFHIDTGARRSW